MGGQLGGFLRLSALCTAQCLSEDRQLISTRCPQDSMLEDASAAPCLSKSYHQSPLFGGALFCPETALKQSAKGHQPRNSASTPASTVQAKQQLPCFGMPKLVKLHKQHFCKICGTNLQSIGIWSMQICRHGKTVIY